MLFYSISDHDISGALQSIETETVTETETGEEWWEGYRVGKRIVEGKVNTCSP